jgi:hypothetical protein
MVVETPIFFMDSHEEYGVYSSLRRNKRGFLLSLYKISKILCPLENCLPYNLPKQQTEHYPKSFLNTNYKQIIIKQTQTKLHDVLLLISLMIR